MYHLLVSYSGWAPAAAVVDLSRAFEYTEERLENFYCQNGTFDVQQISNIPALFASESGGSGEQVARIGNINSVIVNGRKVNIRYSFDPNIPALSQDQFESLGAELHIEPFEFSRTHWAIKDVDLFRVLYESQLVRRGTPTVFSTNALDSIQFNLISAMMPFSADFNNVYATLQQVATYQDLVCQRADNIWEHDAIIQDIVSLICRSNIVICDCTGRNPNVFYEAGIAHTLGKNVILITQNENDIPFDLRHIRYIQYLKNGEGLQALATQLSARIATILRGT